ncbi:MAG TPA: ABC transporter permease [Gemmatimonadaceae bacterium]|nr:ABC transporter permease [Gemmatimonadaceae bacterium]
MRRVFRVGTGRTHVAREVDDELRFHLELRAQRLIAAGMPPELARAEALRQFGDVDAVRESCVTLDEERERAMARTNLLAELRQDVAYALRTLRRNAGFTAVVALTLGLGIGANSAIFTLVNAVILRPLDVREPGRLVAIGNPSHVSSLSQGSPRTDLISYPMYRDLRERGTALVTGLLASGRTGQLDMRAARDSAAAAPAGGAGEAEHPRGRLVSGNYFSVLGVPAQVGRTFDGSEDAAVGASPVVVISDGYWTRRFGRDPRVIGRTITLNGAGFTIIGVARPGFDGEIVGQRTEIWIPVTMQEVLAPHRRALQDRGTSFLLLLGRMAPGVTLPQATEGFGVLVRRILEENAPANQPAAREAARREDVYVSSGARGFSRVRSTYAAPLFTLMVGVGILLLIICANVANLMLARAVARSREIGIRLAIGAGRGRLVRQLLTESLVLALLGAGTGLAVAWWGSRLLLTLAADGAGTIPLDLALDLPVVSFTALLSVLAVALFGLVPALRASSVDLASTIRANSRAVGDRSFGTRAGGSSGGRVLIPAQVALSLVLLVGAALLVRSLRSVQDADVGLDRDHLLIVGVDAPASGYRGERLTTLTQQLSERLARIPGVVAVSFSENGIFSGTESNTTLQVSGFTPRAAEDTIAYYDQVGPGYAHAIGGRLVQGRDFTTQDRAGTEWVALVNETMARFYFPDGSALGRTVTIDDSVTSQIVGVLADTKDHDLTVPPVRRMYLAYQQRPQGDPGTLNFEVRTAGDPAALVSSVRREIRAQDPALAIYDINPLSLLMRQSIREERLLARLATGFGALALLLAAVGLYGVMTYAITRRTNEIGLRVALGAQRRNVIAMILGDAFELVALGALVGVPLALAAARLLRNQLHGVGTTDPIAIAVALLVLGASAAAAAWLPAMRAARMDPLLALRSE